MEVPPVQMLLPGLVVVAGSAFDLSISAEVVVCIGQLAYAHSHQQTCCYLRTDLFQV